MQNNQIHITFSEMEVKELTNILNRYSDLERAELERHIQHAKSIKSETKEQSFEVIAMVIKSSCLASMISDAKKFTETLQQKALSL